MDLRVRIVEALKEGKKEAAVAKGFRVGVATVYRYKNLEEAGELEPKTSPGRPAKIGAEQYRELKAMVDAENDGSLEEYCGKWEKQTGETLSPSAMCRTLARAKLTRKKRASGQVSKTH